MIRRAGMEQADEIARLYRRTAAAAWDFLYPHTPEEDHAFFRAALGAGPVYIIAEDGAIVGFCAMRRGWIDHLFIAPERQGLGVGQALLRRALRGRSCVRLWTFQRNDRSRDFYRRQGFVEVRFTDGAHNEEKEPDVLLEWRKP